MRKHRNGPTHEAQKGDNLSFINITANVLETSSILFHCSPAEGDLVLFVLVKRQNTVKVKGKVELRMFKKTHITF